MDSSDNTNTTNQAVVTEEVNQAEPREESLRNWQINTYF